MRRTSLLLASLLAACAVCRSAAHSDEHPLRGKTFHSLEKLPGGERRDGTINKIHWKLTFTDETYEWRRYDVIAPGSYTFDARTGVLTVAAKIEASFDSKTGVLTWGGRKYKAAKTDETAETEFITPDELDKLPRGIKVVHEPKIALATLTGESKHRSKFTWWYKTTVAALEGDVTIIEFGGFGWQDGKWVGGFSITGKPYAATEFAEWYKCPSAILKKGESYADPTNWSTAAELLAGKTRWYFIGVDENGKKVKGEAVIELKADIDPNKPED